MSSSRAKGLKSEVTLMKVHNFYALILHFVACTTKCTHVTIGAGEDHKHNYTVYLNSIFKSDITDMVTVRTLHLVSDKCHRRRYLGCQLTNTTCTTDDSTNRLEEVVMKQFGCHIGVGGVLLGAKCVEQTPWPVSGTIL